MTEKRPQKGEANAMFRNILLITIFALVSASCTPAVIPVPDFTATPAAAPTAVPTAVPTVAPTSTVAPTETSAPTEIPTPMEPFTLTSSVFENNGGIPVKYSCDGTNISPALAWNEPPAGTVSFALIVDDPDAVSVAGIVWDHWVLFNIPAETRTLDEGTRPPAGSLQGVTSGGAVTYEGPCPPPGKPHHYNFTLYALDTSLELKAGATKKAVLQAIDGHILAQSQLTGLYPAK
jgi:Raf kinase inhibitor-like YbhB/YbcL family protein